MRDKLSPGALAFGAALTVTLLGFTQQAMDRLVLGRSGSVSGSVTFMPPDGTGWYHIDNPGGQRLRISGGGTPGVYEYMTISHPGVVTIRGDLNVTGNLTAQGRAFGMAPTTPIAPLPDQGGKADNASPEDVQNLQTQIDALWSRMNALIQRANRAP